MVKHLAWIIPGAGLSYAVYFTGYPAGGPESWAHFGDYFGGVLGPLIGMVTVYLVYRTLLVTRDLRDDSSRMLADQREALQRQFESMDAQVHILRDEAKARVLADRLQSIERRLEGVLNDWNQTMTQTSLSFGQLSYSAKDLIYSPKNLVGLRRSYHDESSMNHAIAASITGSSSQIIPILEELGRYCEEYETAGGGSELPNYYRLRVRPAVQLMIRLHLLKPETGRRLNPKLAFG